MTTIAWDGNLLAADRKGNSDGMARDREKIIIVPDRRVAITWEGRHECGLVLADWWLNGCDVDKWPAFQEDDEAWTRLLIFGVGEILEYERLPKAQAVTETPMAWGSGRAFALGAMAANMTAAEAVKIAGRYDIYSGLGVNFVRISDIRPEACGLRLEA